MIIWSNLIGDYEPRVFGIHIMTKSRNLRGKALIEYKKSLKLNDLQREILVGTLLGDASIPSREGKAAYLVKFEQQIARKEYIHHLYTIFEPFVGTPPKIRNIVGGGAKDRQSIWFRTYSHSAFKFYDDIFYVYNAQTQRRKKRVPKNIHKILTHRSLAYWFMDDGTFYGKSPKRKYLLSTQSFSLSDQKLLVRALQQLNVQANIYKDKDKYRLYIVSSSQFIKIVQEYIHPVFLYKM